MKEWYDRGVDTPDTNTEVIPENEVANEDVSGNKEIIQPVDDGNAEEEKVNELLKQGRDTNELNLAYSSPETTNKKPKILLKILSFLFPIVGIILFFIKKKDCKKIAKSYLKSAIAGIAVGIIIIIVSGIASVAIIEKQKKEMEEREGQFIVTDEGEDAIVVDGIPVIIQDIDDGEEDFDKENYDIVVEAPSVDEAVEKVEEDAKKSEGKIAEIK